jgi:23S rRNA (uracil1939-C5)-methyltransferase
MDSSLSPDLQPGAAVTLTIDTLAFGGEGIGRAPDGRAVFVPLTAPGDIAEVRMREVKKNFGRAELVRVVTPGPHRITPPCPYYGTCGGCQYQHLDPEEELRVKQAQVDDILRRLGKLPDANVLPIVRSPQVYGYRNRITVHAAHGKVGFHRAGSHEIIDIAHCLLAVPEVNEALAALRRPSKRPQEGHFSLRAPGLPPAAFHQINGFLLEPLRALVAEWTRGTGAEKHLVEGYCGGGFFTGAVADAFAKVWGIEADPRSLRDARRLPAQNVQWIEGRVEERLAAALAEAEADNGPTVALLDPPREGLAPGALAALREHPPQRIVYVSCDPATLARDVAALSGLFVLDRVQPFDLFPRTAQIETVSELRRK